MSTYPLILKPGVILVETDVVGPKKTNSVRMILDTGATYTMVSPEILIECGYDLSRSGDRRAVTTASGIEYTPFLRVRALSSLGYTMRGIEVCAHSLPPNLPARGLLGLNFMRHFNIHFRFLDQVLEISK